MSRNLLYSAKGGRKTSGNARVGDEREGSPPMCTPRICFFRVGKLGIGGDWGLGIGDWGLGIGEFSTLGRRA